MESLFTKKQQVGNKIKGLLKSPVFWTAVIAIATVFSAFIAYKIYNLSFSKRGEPPQPSITTSKALENEYQKKIQEAKKLYQNRELDQAIGILEPLIERGYESVESVELLINCYFEKGGGLMASERIDEGIEFFRLAYNKFSDIKRTKQALKKNLQDAKMYEEQRNNYEKAVEFAKELNTVCPSSESKKEIGRLLSKHGRRYLVIADNPFSALVRFKEAHQFDPEDQVIIEDYARTHELIGDLQSKKNSLYQKDLAIENYHEALILNQKNPTVEKKIASLYLIKYDIFIKSGNYLKAEDCLKKVVFYHDDLLQIDGELRKLMDAAEACLTNGLYQEAAIYFKEALVKSPFAPFLYYKKTTKILVSAIGPLPPDSDEIVKFAKRKVNLNGANLAEIKLRLEISFKKAIKIIENRPYADVKELLSKGVFQKSEFNKIKDIIAVQ